MESLCSLENFNETRKYLSLISVLHSCACETRRQNAVCCVLHISNRVKCVGYEPIDETLNFPHHIEGKKETKRLFFSIQLQKFYKVNFLQVIILETTLNFSFLHVEDTITNLYRIYVTYFT
jgi:hypothetical protein